MIFYRRFVSERQLTNATGYNSDQANGGRSHGISRRNGERVRYLHSDIDTVERMEISATCVWASSTCWWGSTYCAKSGYAGGFAGGDPRRRQRRLLRSERSLIQTIGRAARNVNGKRFSTAIRSPRQWRKRLAKPTSSRETAEVQRGTRYYAAGLNKKVVDILALGQNIAKTKARAEENRDRLLSRIMCRWICR